MAIVYCKTCDGSGRVVDSDRSDLYWWQASLRKTCDKCGGDGYSKPPGWPSESEMERLRPEPPPPPPCVHEWKFLDTRDVHGLVVDRFYCEHCLKRNTIGVPESKGGQ